MTRQAVSADVAGTREFRMVYRYDGRSAEITFTNADNIARGTDKELYKIFMVWAKVSTHQKVADSALKKKVTKALRGDKAAEQWLRSCLAAFFVKHHASDGGSNTLVVEDLHGERLEQYVRTLPDTSDTWVVRKLGCLTFRTPAAVQAVC